LGTGGFGVVKKGYQKSTNQPYAIKIYKKQAMEQEDELSLENEVIIMSQVLLPATQINHPNIVKLYEVYEDKDKYCLVLELMTGG
jgi:calcium-dependent protein kinase